MSIGRNLFLAESYLEKEQITTFAFTLGVSKAGIVANAQYLAELGIPPDNSSYPILLGSSPRLKRQKIVHLARMLLDHEETARAERIAAIRSAKALVRREPRLLIDSIVTLQRKEPKLRQKLMAA